MGKKVFVLLLSSVLLLQVSVVPGAAEPLALDSLLQEAIEKNPDILAAKKRWEASQARIPVSKTLPDPVVGVSFQKIPKGSFKLNQTMPEDRMLSVSQFFPSFGKLSLQGKIAVIESQIFATEYKNKELDIINQVSKAYYDLFMTEKETELSRESLTLLEGVGAIAGTKYATGDLSQEEVYKIYTEIARLNTSIKNLEQEASARRTLLNTLLNREPEGVLGSPQLSEDASFNMDIRSLYQATLLGQPELIVLSYAVEKNKHAQLLAKKSLFPEILAELTLRGITSGSVGPWDFLLAFSVPLWFWKKQRYEIKEAIANVEEAQAAYETMKNKAFAATKSLAARIEQAKNKMALYKKELLPLLEDSTEVSLNTFRSGRGNFMALLDNQRMLVDNKMNYYRALVDYHANLADLQRALGVGLEK